MKLKWFLMIFIFRIIMGFVKKGFLAAFLETKNIPKILVIR